MAKRNLFTVETPLGYRVTLSRDRWRDITRYKHPAMAGREKEVRKCLENPAVVRESAKEALVHLYTMNVTAAISALSLRRRTRKTVSS